MLQIYHILGVKVLIPVYFCFYMEWSSIQDQSSIPPHQQETQPLEQVPRGLLLLPPSVTGQLPAKLGHSSSCIRVPPTQCLHHHREELSLKIWYTLEHI